MKLIPMLAALLAKNTNARQKVKIHEDREVRAIKIAVFSTRKKCKMQDDNPP